MFYLYYWVLETIIAKISMPKINPLLPTRLNKNGRFLPVPVETSRTVSPCFSLSLAAHPDLARGTIQKESIGMMPCIKM